MRNKLAVLLLVFCSHIFPQQITLSDTTNQYDYIIITIPEYVQSCQVFKEHKETVRGLKTLIVDTTQIFAEFNSDSLPQNNIREFISYAGTYWQDPKPEYVLFVGTSTQVPNYLITGSFPPALPEHRTDYFYRINLNNPYTTELSFFVGRVPAKNTIEINNYFSKVIEYENIVEPLSWMNNALFIFQDYADFGFDNASYSLANQLPSYINPYFISNSDTSIYYGNNDTILSRLGNEGAAAVWFMGTGYYDYFISSEYFSINDVHLMSNNAKYFVSFFVANQGNIIDTNSSITSEVLFLNSAGSLAGIGPAGISFWQVGLAIHNKWVHYLFSLSPTPLGALFNLPELGSTGSFYYMWQSLNLWGDPSIILNYSTVTSVDNDITTVPNEYLLSQNYPNPFNPSTRISWQSPVSSHQTLNVFDILGNEIATLVNEYKPAGKYEVDFDGSRLASGIYFYKLTAGNYSKVMKMMLLR